MNIKVIEGLEPWEVMKRASEGEPVAAKGDGWGKEYVKSKGPDWDWFRCEYAIIDTSTHEIDWDRVNWGFFNQYGGLPVKVYGGNGLLGCATIDVDNYSLRESPFYYWPGGEQPVPDMVIVEIKARSGYERVGEAISFNWDASIDEIIAFRITGELS